jgi:transposase
MFEETQADGSPASTSCSNASTKDDLITRAKEHIEAGEQSIHDAAELIAIAQEQHGATQREIAEAVGKSVGWVNRLLQWRREGYRDDTPFGPGSRLVRERRKRAQATEQRAPRTADADNEDTGAERLTTEVGRQVAEHETATSTETSPLAGFKSAVDHWFPKMD